MALTTKILMNLGLVLALTALGGATSHAAISLGTPLDVLETSVHGQCNISITFEEPYSAVASDCYLEKDEVVVSLEEIRNYEIGWRIDILERRNSLFA